MSFPYIISLSRLVHHPFRQWNRTRQQGLLGKITTEEPLQPYQLIGLEEKRGLCCLMRSYQTEADTHLWHIKRHPDQKQRSEMRGLLWSHQSSIFRVVSGKLLVWQSYYSIQTLWDFKNSHFPFFLSLYRLQSCRRAVCGQVSKLNQPCRWEMKSKHILGVGVYHCMHILITLQICYRPCFPATLCGWALSLLSLSIFHQIPLLPFWAIKWSLYITHDAPH